LLPAGRAIQKVNFVARLASRPPRRSVRLHLLRGRQRGRGGRSHRARRGTFAADAGLALPVVGGQSPRPGQRSGGDERGPVVPAVVGVQGHGGVGRGRKRRGDVPRFALRASALRGCTLSSRRPSRKVRNRGCNNPYRCFGAYGRPSSGRTPCLSCAVIFVKASATGSSDDRRQRRWQHAGAAQAAGWHTLVAPAPPPIGRRVLRYAHP
jgi:hypothetical protein